jgi:protein involved in polysaccharide export with SLBB domain
MASDFASMKSAALVAAVAAALLACAAPLQARDIETPAPAVSGPNGVVRYELGAGDKLKVLFYERPDLSGEFAVRTDGHLGLPLLGLFPVDGKDVSELEKDIVAAYVAATGRTPRLLIDVIERRPFYVVGVVQRSGAYPFVPGMTVLHAVALAGGTYRAASTDLPSGSASNVNREISRLRQAEATLKRAIARAARLVAERDGKDLTEIPEQLLRLTNRTEAQALIMAEKRVLQAKAADYKSRKESGLRIIETINHEIAELKAQQKQTEEKVRLNNLHLADINTLYGKGLQRRSELLSLQALIATNEGELREAGARKARARVTGLEPEGVGRAGPGRDRPADCHGADRRGCRQDIDRAADGRARRARRQGYRDGAGLYDHAQQAGPVHISRRHRDLAARAGRRRPHQRAAAVADGAGLVAATG